MQPSRYWEDNEEATECHKNIEAAFLVTEKLRGGRAHLKLQDTLPLTRVLEIRGKVCDLTDCAVLALISQWVFCR
jgi:hypothetical protein